MSSNIQQAPEKKSFFEKIKTIGPGALVVAAFIGPGTVTTCTLSGASYGYTLLWAVLFSIVATMILQEMAARLGIITRLGLGEALRNTFTSPLGRGFSVTLVILAIFIGCCAYETGNITGGAVGINAITGIDMRIIGPLMGIISFSFLWSGSYKAIEKLLITLVITMSVVFIVTAIIIKPDFAAILRGFFVPTIPKGALTFTIGLIGTTVVPYNLFLHASAVQERFKTKEELADSRLDTILSIGLGGIITAAIIITAAAAFHASGIEVKNAGQMATQLEPLLGAWAKWFFAIGLFAAGFSSAITAPLAAAYATSGALNWEKNLKGNKFRAIWMIVLAIGIILSGLGSASPLSVIVIAQATNGILLPIVALYLLWIMNNKNILGQYTNSALINILGGIVALVTVVLGYRGLVNAFNNLLKILGS